MKQPKISKITKAIAFTLAGSIVMLQPVSASLPDTSIFNDANEISDEELSGMRGRYVGTGEILYFGVEMYTQWTTKDGTVQNTPGVNLTMNQNFQPTVTIVTQNQPQNGGGNNLPVNGQGNVSINGGLDNVSGVGQSIQIGGDGNSIRNDFNINIERNGSGSPAPNGIVLNGAGVTTVGSTTVTLSGNSLSMNVNVPGQGQVLQQLKGGSGFLQSAKIGGDVNRIHNTININAGLRSAMGLPSAGMRNAMNSLRGIRAFGH